MTQLLSSKEKSGEGGRQRWSSARKNLVRALRLSDFLVVAASVAIAAAIRFGIPDSKAELYPNTVLYLAISCLLPFLWMFALQIADAYDARVLGHGTGEFQSVIKGTIGFFATLAIISYATNLQLARGYVLVALPVGLLGLLAERALWRQRLIERRKRDELQVRVLAVGDVSAIRRVAATLGNAHGAGYRVVAACSSDATGHIAGVPVIGTEADAAETALRSGADVVACVSSPSMNSEAVKRIAWRLEGSQVEFMVIPALADVSAPRIKTHPVNGMPLLMVDAPEFTGPKLFWKNLSDKLMASAFLLFFSPMLLIVAAGIWLHDRGPVFFLQERVGQNGRTFKMFKFRSMVVNAEEIRKQLIQQENDGNGVLFKLRNDPRVTPIGKWIRRFSVDEFPQLLNVLKGDMSIVGPRPPLASEVEKYETDVRRRLLVKPGLTGLWQVNGRSDLSWEEAVRFDLFYVENWSLMSDLAIIARTASAVVSKRGAY